MKSFKVILNESVSASKLVKSLQNVEDYKQGFLTYLDALNLVLSYKLNRSQVETIKVNFQTLEPAQFVKFLALNLPESAKIDGSSFLTAIERVAKKAKLEGLK
jgi:hypothetical protein